jgi:hypothetical protein
MMPVLHQSRWPLSDKVGPPYKGFAARMIQLLSR